MKTYVHQKNKTLSTNVHISFICSSPKLETTQMSFTKWRFQRTVAGNAPQQRKEWTTDIHDNLDESPGNHAEWKKPIPEGRLLCGSSYVTWYNIL